VKEEKGKRKRKAGRVKGACEPCFPSVQKVVLELSIRERQRGRSASSQVQNKSKKRKGGRAG